MRTNIFNTLTFTFCAVFRHKAEIIFSLILALILVAGSLLSSGGANTGKKDILVYSIGLVTLWVISFFFVIFIKNTLSKQKSRKSNPFLPKFSDRKMWLLTSLLIFLLYVPVIFICFSVLTIDSWSSIAQVTGDAPLSKHHPLIFTAFVSIFIHIGLTFNSIELGTILFSVAQSAILALIFARVIVWMRNEGIGRNGIIAAFVFYAILPINAYAGIIMWKDILFAGFGLLLLLLLRQVCLEKSSFFTVKNIVFFITIAFLFCTWRNNGLYAYVLTTLLIISMNHRVFLRKQFLLLMVSPLVLFSAYTALTSLIVKPTASVETMSVPLQQIARTVKYHGDTLSKEDQAKIDEVLPFDRLDDLYRPNISDPVKGSFDIETYNNDRPRYVELWLKLFKEHKKTFIAAFLYNTYGYVYPFAASPTSTATIVNNSNQLNTLDGYQDTAHENKNKSAAIRYRDLVMGVFPLLSNIGFYTCLILLCAYIAIIRKRRELDAIFILLACLFLTTVLGPVNGEFRYLYLFVVSTPYILTAIQSNKSSESL